MFSCLHTVQFLYLFLFSPFSWFISCHTSCPLCQFIRSFPAVSRFLIYFLSLFLIYLSIYPAACPTSCLLVFLFATCLTSCFTSYTALFSSHFLLSLISFFTSFLTSWFSTSCLYVPTDRRQSRGVLQSASPNIPSRSRTEFSRKPPPRDWYIYFRA